MDNSENNHAQGDSCIVKAIMLDEVDPNELSIEAIHASSIRLITNFMKNPSPDSASTVVKMLSALAKHKDAFKTDSGYNVYHQASLMWQGVVNNMIDTQARAFAACTVH